MRLHLPAAPLVAALPLALALSVAPVVTAPASAGADRGPRATINVCDTAKFPDKVGARGIMPGNGTQQRMYMRFRAQYYSRGSSSWAAVSGARSRWLYAGSAKYRTGEVGFTFSFKAPAAGTTTTVRGIVDYEWREGRKVVRRTRTFTTAGFPSQVGSDPRGFSSRTCEIHG